MKAIPGADQDLINKTGLLVDRMNVDIEERKNPKLQKRMMSKRYWNNMIEVNNK